MVKPSTALAGLVACEAGLVVVNDAVAVLPRARFVPPGVELTLTPARWNRSTIRALPERLTWVAVCSVAAALKFTVAGVPRIVTAPEDEFQVRWVRSLTVKTRTPLT